MIKAIPWFKPLIGLVVLLLAQACSTTPDVQQADISAFKHPLLIVIDDPRGIRKQFGARGPGYNANVNYAQDPVLQRVTEKLINDYQLQYGDDWPIRSLGVHCIVIESPPADVLARLEQDERVKWVQVFNEFDTLNQDSFTPASPAIISPSISLPNFGDGVDIVVIDTGADLSHPAFAQSNISYQDFVRGMGRGNKEAHGTAVLGLLGAYDKNGNSPVQGLTKKADLHHFRGCWQSENGRGKCSTLTLALALDAAVGINPRVLNLSLSGPSDKVLEALIEKLVSQGTIVISAHDAERTQDRRFPRSQTGVIYAYGTNSLEMTDIPEHTFLASSTAISLSTTGSYDVFSGHSIATPQLTAITASLLSEDPHISKNTISTRLTQWINANIAEQ